MQLKRCCFPCAVNADLCGRPRRRASVGWWGGSDPCSAVGIHYFIRRFGRLPGREQPRTCRCGSDTNTLPWNKGTPHPHICSAARRLLCTPKPPPVTLRTAAGRSAALIFFFLIFFFPPGFVREAAGERRDPPPRPPVLGESSPHRQGSWRELLAGVTFPIPEEKKLLLLQSVLARQG